MNELVITPFDDEPRVLDTALAERLGMARPTNIRTNIIEANLDELEGFGHVARAACNVAMPRGGYKTGMAYYLNEEQALLVCLLSRTERAKQVRAEVIRVFTAWRRGELVSAKPALPDFTSPAAAARAWAEQFEAREAAEAKLIEAKPKAETYDQLVEANGLLTLTAASKSLGLNPWLEEAQPARFPFASLQDLGRERYGDYHRLHR